MAECRICGKPTSSHPWYCAECMINYPTDKERSEKAEKEMREKYFGLDSSSLSVASGLQLQYVVLQVTLKEKFLGTGSGNLTELEKVINEQAAKGYRLHTITTSNANSVGFMGGDRIQATMVFEKI